MEALREELKLYPSTFDITENVKALSERNLIQIKDKLLLELCSTLNEYSTSMEKVRTWNLLSYLYFVLGDRENANKYNQDVLEESPNNVIALANKAWFSFTNKKNLIICEDYLKKLKTLKSDSLAYLIAKAELAFTYSKFGLHHYYKAISIFREVMEEANAKEQEYGDNYTICTSGKKQDTFAELKCVWIHRYALTLKRLLHNTNVSVQDSVHDIIARHKVVFEMFESIVRLEGDSECLLRYKARALVEAGILAYGVNKNRSIFLRGMKDLLPSNSAILMPIYKYFVDALKLFPNDVFVLERSGRYFRYIDDIEASILLLQAAVEIRGTSFGYHHLAISYIRLLEYGPTKLWHCLDSLSKEYEHNLTLVRLKTNKLSFTVKKVNVSELLAKLTIDSVANQTKRASHQCLQDCESFHESTTLEFEKQDPTNFAIKSELNPMAKIFVPKTEMKCNDCCLSHETDVFCFKQCYGAFDPPIFCGNFLNYKGIPFQQEPEDKNEGFHWTTQGQSTRKSRTYPYKAENCSNVRNMNNQLTIQHEKGPSLDFVANCLRNPKSIEYEKYKDVIEIIIFLLDTATRISPNMAALYDKAVFYFQMKQTDKALDVFESIMQDDKNFCTPVMLANTYEQAALCISEILEGNEKLSAERKKQLINDRQYYLKSSIEVACSIIDKHPYLGHCWRSSQTLRYILLSNSEVGLTKETLKDLWFLFTKMENNEGVITVLQELKDLTYDAEKREICEEIVKKYLCVHKFEEAVIALSMLARLDDMRSCVNQTLYSQVYVESGLNAFNKRNFDKARLLIGKAFAKPPGDDVTEAITDISDDCYDIFILSNLDDEEQGRNLMLLLNNLGLNTTFNSVSKSIKPGTPEIEGLTKVMNKSNAFVILVNWELENKEMQHLVDRIRKIVEDRLEKTMIFCVTNKVTHIPSTCCLSTYKRINIDTEKVSESEIGCNDNNEGFKNILIELASV